MCFLLMCDCRIHALLYDDTYTVQNFRPKKLVEKQCLLTQKPTDLQCGPPKAVDHPPTGQGQEVVCGSQTSPCQSRKSLTPYLAYKNGKVHLYTYEDYMRTKGLVKEQKECYDYRATILRDLTQCSPAAACVRCLCRRAVCFRTQYRDHPRVHKQFRVHNYLSHLIFDNTVTAITRPSMEPKIIKEEMIERDSGIPEENAIIINNNNNNKDSSYRIQTRKSKIKSKENVGFSSTNSTTESSGGDQLLSPSLQPVGCGLNDIEPESGSPPSENNAFRNHNKLKRFLTTLVQFSGQLSLQMSDRVKVQIFNLVSNLISVEEFHHNLQEMTNFPLKPFVLPFLRTHIPSFQRELNSLARNNKQTLQQYLKQHENAYLDRDSQPSEPSEIFHQVERIQTQPLTQPVPPSPSSRDNSMSITNSSKRPYADSNVYFENGCNSDLDYQQPCIKRPNLNYSMPFMYHHPHLGSQEPQNSYSVVPLLPLIRGNGDPEENNKGGHVEDEWKNIHVMLNCILSMVEKTKKALGILQERGLAETNFPEWIKKKSTEEVLSQTIRLTEEKIEGVKKRAEESMNEIKLQAMAELQKIVLTAESKIVELVAMERTKISGAVAVAAASSAGRSLAGSTVSTVPTAAVSQISPSSLMPQYNSCWNCGRKAHETCSGCNTAQYCSSFCQHKDWETHHQTCCIHSAAAAAKTANKQPPSAADTSAEASTGNRATFRLSPLDSQAQPPPSSVDKSTAAK
ncbi:protein CBFA2T1 [Adelges cooleyi]|uniref:protein CBFA2T1 n=1 Tax=Adelges cooleyi TaxID=133065 RepID=UPI00217FE6F1|nr:protein CBFA2T1 [Adelges cooleyi]